MRDQLFAIAWAQWKTARNHLPRTTFGSLLAFSLGIAWYGGFATFAVFLAVSLPGVPISLLQRWLGAAFLGLLLIWQVLPLATATGGWSLDLKRLQIYPIATHTLLTLDAILRVTAGCEMLLVLLGISMGLLLHPAIPLYAPLLLVFLFIPFNLLLSLAVRDFVTRGFQKGRLREVFTVLFLGIAVLPQLIVRMGWFGFIKRYLLVVANANIAPWHHFATAAVGPGRWSAVALSLFWVVLAYAAAARQFGAALREEEMLRSSGQAHPSRLPIARLLAYPSTWFADPIGAIVNKEIRTLLRMPRFRVVFALSILLGAALVPVFLQGGHSSGVVGRHSAVLMSLYGLIMLADALMWNVFGFDRNGTQMYFAAPIALRAVLYGKNIVAGLFLFLQAVLVAVVAALCRQAMSPASLGIQFLSVAVITTFFLALGNVSSVLVPRAIDPRATMRKQGSGAIQLWILGAMTLSVLLLGVAYLAEWASDSQWAVAGILLVEWIIGGICYRVASDYALEQASVRREELLTALSKRSSVAGS